MSVLDLNDLGTQVGCAQNGIRLTPEEYDRIDDWDDSYRYELLNGVLIVTPPPGMGEVGPNDQLGHLIRNYKGSHPKGAVVDTTGFEIEIAVGDNRRRADRVVWIGLGRPPRRLVDVPAIAIEFVSKSRRDWRRDYVEKRSEYAGVGVKEYWVIDRFAREMTVFRQPDEVVVTKEGGVYQTPLMPGFELPLAEVLAEADKFAEDD